MKATHLIRQALLQIALCHVVIQGFLVPVLVGSTKTTTRLCDMKRPLLDQLASMLFKLENERVERSSEVDDKGRVGEPMAWSEKQSWANRFSEIMATKGYGFKQFVAEIVAGDYDQNDMDKTIDDLILQNDVSMFSFTTCPFCRKAKDALEERDIPYQTVELDELEGNMGNQIRAQLGRRTGRTSVPSIFVKGEFIGGCNDGPGLIPLMENGGFDAMMQKKKA
mmetsp:Transcript_21301/g.40466  ORF Transcript_21301/g.40466 Transcript_21301/m.40466 type:complete len:223 (+) Transcript_21301:86-754(+)|eukprot:scaffold2512_cov164-Amphora_coffeaeformis.AAC.4